jgi:HSP20 family protein
MAIRELIPWGRGRELARGSGFEPFVAMRREMDTLRREMDRLFDDTFRGFDLAPFGFSGTYLGGTAWPRVDATDTGKEVKVMAELPGLDEKDVEVKLADGMLCISGEKKEVTEDKDRLIGECYYGRFERRIPIQDVDEDKVSASFKNGILTVSLPKTPGAAEKVKQIPIAH